MNDDHVTDEDLMCGFVCVEEMLDMGYTEVIKGNRLLYFLGSEVIAAECRSCSSLKIARSFSLSNQEFSGLRRDCDSCNSQKRKLTDSYITQDYVNRRRAKKASLPFHETSNQRNFVWQHFDNSCALTGVSADLHADHAIPIESGHVGTIYGNMIPLAGRLNNSKSDKHLYEWFDTNKNRFNLPQRRFDALIDYLAKTNDMTTQEYRKYVDWVFDNPRMLDEETGELIFV